MSLPAGVVGVETLSKEEVARIWPGPFASLDAVKEAVVKNQDVLTVTMEDLRDAYGAGRLGQHVRTGISKALAGLGLGHYPLELPNDQELPVRLYQRGTPVADIIDAVLNVNSVEDDVLREAADKGASLKLTQIRELVCK